MGDTFDQDVFLSYSRANIAEAQQVQRRLQAQGISVWRDQESIYGGQQWPKAIGEGIAARKLFVLLWSKEAAASHFVEFEWNTAIALRKVIKPVLLDATPLPPSLRAINGIAYESLSESSYLQNQLANITSTDRKQQQAVVDKLAALPDDEPEQVVSKAQMIFPQEGTKKASTPKKWYERWQAQVALVAGILTIATLLLDIPKKWREAFPSEPEEKIETFSVKGNVLTTDNQGVPGAIVKLDKLPGDSAVTTSDGGFIFEEVPGEVGEAVRVNVHAEKYLPRDEYHTMPGPIQIRLQEKTN